MFDEGFFGWILKKNTQFVVYCNSCFDVNNSQSTRRNNSGRPTSCSFCKKRLDLFFYFKIIKTKGEKKNASFLLFDEGFFGWILKNEMGNLLFIATAALMSTTANQQGETIPAALHLVHFVRKD